MALSDWKRWDRNRYYNAKLDHILVLQEGTNKMFIMRTDGKTSQTPNAPSRIKLVEFAKKYMRTH